MAAYKKIAKKRMKSYRNYCNRIVLWMMIIILVNVEDIWRCEGCLETERIALLEIQSFKFLIEFSPDEWGANCCKWPFVVCNSTTGRVTELDLLFKRDENQGERYLNATLFLPFQKLKVLNLQGNQILGCIKNEGFERLASLVHLETLDLGFNNFRNEILSSLAALSSLKYLDIAYNRLNGTLNIEELNNLSSLVKLNIQSNEIEDLKSPHGGEEILKLRNLEYLNLGHNRFSNSILSALSGLSSLKFLYAEGNYQLKLGSFNLKELDELFPNLLALGLSGYQINKFEASRDLKGPRNLSTLYLEGMAVEGRSTLLESLGALSYLKTLYVSDSNFRGIIIGEGLHNLSNVEELWLSESSVDEKSLESLGRIMSSLKLFYSTGGFDPINIIPSLPSRGWHNFKNLEHLNLFGFLTDGSFLHTIGVLTSLKTLSLSSCGLNGTIPAQHGLCQLNHLQELDLSDNYLSGNLPWCLANLTSLQSLVLSFNHFTGNISSSPITNLTSLEFIRLNSNLFRIPISFSPFFNHSKLKDFFGSENIICADHDHIVTTTPKLQLEVLTLSDYGDVGEVPKFLYYQNNLQYVDLSHLKMKGKFPYWLLENNTQLESLSLANNSLSGSVKLPSHSHKNMLYLDISKNLLSGSIPTEIGALFPNLVRLNTSGNCFNGSMPPSLGNMKSLQSLDLSNNALSGRIPEQLTTDCFYLYNLILSNNSLEGPFFSENANLKGLQTLYLDGNKFSGNLPSSLSKSIWLRSLDVSDNHLSGKIPEWMGNMFSLELLDLSGNNLSGNIPAFFGSPCLEQVYLSRNKLQGSIGNTFDKCMSLIILDLSHNLMTGRIPNWIGLLQGLNILLLSYNNFEGEIPIELCKLNILHLVDLSNNQLYGHVLPCLKCSSSQHFEDVPNFFTKGSSIPLPRRQQIEVKSVVSSPPSSLQPQTQPVEVTTKSNSYFYQPRTLSYFSGIDLSCNNFRGQIPLEFGNLSKIQTLNLSHNSLTGPIPSTFGNMDEIESLDLSNNRLDGKIPTQITKLHSLSVFNVSYNNLSGKTPKRVLQFGTFDESSYKGNPFLYGCPLPRNCSEMKSQSILPSTSQNSTQNEESRIDMEVFYVSFGVAYMVVLLAIAAILCINPYWKRVWFYFIDVITENCYYFIIDNVSPLFKFRWFR